MEYTGFTFTNFKGIGDLELELSGPVTTLIGLNESGKTTILEAIFCFSYGAENLDALDPTMASLRQPERWIPIAHRGNFNDKIQIRARVRLSDDDKTAYRKTMLNDWALHLSKVPDELLISETYYFENSRHIQRRNEKTWNLSVSGTKGKQQNARTYNASTPEWQAAVTYLKTLLPSIWYFPNFLFELPDRFVIEDGLEDEPAEDHDKNAFYRLTFEEILHSLGSGANLGTHVAARLKTGDRADQRNLKSLLLDMSREITKTVFDGWNRIFGRLPISQEVELDAASEGGRTFIELKIRSPDGYYDLSERSLGFRWFFMFLLMTSYRGLARAKGGTILLLDEPASNLHSSAQAELLKSFEHLAETCRVVYTTHSHHMINIKWLDSAYVIKNEALGEFSLEHYLTTRTATATSISATKYRRFVAENPSNTSYFQPVLDLLDYRPSDLELVPNVVLVEGKSDFYILRYCIDVLGFQPSLKLIPGTGASSLDPLIRLHIGWGKSFVVLLDGDAEGRTQRQRYVETFGGLLDDRVCLLPDACGVPTVLEVENLLTATATETVVSRVFPPGTQRPSAKKALAQAIMELLAGRIVIAFDAITTERIQDLLQALDKKLSDQR